MTASPKAISSKRLSSVFSVYSPPSLSNHRHPHSAIATPQQQSCPGSLSACAENHRSCPWPWPREPLATKPNTHLQGPAGWGLEGDVVVVVVVACQEIRDGGFRFRRGTEERQKEASRAMKASSRRRIHARSMVGLGGCKPGENQSRGASP